MTLSTASELKTEIAADLARSDVTSGSSILDRFIIQTERYLNSRLRVREMVKDTALTVDSELEALPSDFLEVKHIEFDNDPQLVEPVAQRVQSATGQGTSTGDPVNYTLVYDDDNSVYQFKFGPIPDGSRAATLYYYAKLATLTSNATNPLFLKYPDLYLNGCLYYAFRKYRDVENRDYYLALLNAEIDALNTEKHNQNIPSGARVRALRRL